jgi:NADH-quinone oxidoreductase subunit D
MSDSTLNPRTVDDPRRRPSTGADGRGDPAAAEDVDVALAGGIPGSTDDADPYGLPDDAGVGAPAEGRVFTATGGDWDEIAEEAANLGQERIVVNMGPQHPSTHGVLRLILEIDGETVTEARCGIGYLHTGIEKNMEYRTWTQGVTFCTRMDYLAPFYQEAAYCVGVEKLLGITDDVPERASVIRVMMMELCRVSSHVVALATGGLEIGALTVMTIGFRMRERVLKLFELVTGLRMNHAYIRPGGLAQDLPPGALETVIDALPDIYQDITDIEMLANENPLVRSRLVDVGYLDLTGCMSLGLTGPVLRATGLPHDLRKSQPYCGYQDYDFDVVTWDTCDAYGRLRIRIEEMRQSLRIVEQCVQRLRDLGPGPVMVGDRKIAWPAQLAIGGDGMGNSLEHIREIMGQSMEALIHHFKLVTEGFRVPAGQVYQAVEAPRGELAVHLVSDGGTRPYRAHFRDPSFVNLQAVAVMCEGGQIADVIAAVASLDPVMGGVDR